MEKTARNNRVLFVDDEPNVLSALRRQFRANAADWDMTFLDDPLASVDAFRAHPFDVVVSDVAMPAMTGLELAATLKGIDPLVQVLILTGTASLDTAVDAINETGVFRFYLKPCPAEILAQGVAEALAERARLATKNTAGDGAPDGGSFGKAVLGRLSIGVVVVDRSAAIMYMNPSGLHIVSRGDGLVSGRDHVLRAVTPAQTRLLHEAVRIGAVGRAGGDPSAFLVERAGGANPYAVSVSPFEEGSGHVLLFVSDPDNTPRISPDTVSRLFDLTGREAILASCLAEGLTLEQSAIKMGVTTSTARTYLKQVFLKTETGRQAELVRLILTSPALIAAPPRQES